MEFVVRPYPGHYTCLSMSHVGCFLFAHLVRAEFPPRVLPLLAEATIELLVCCVVKQNILGQDYAYAYRKMWTNVISRRIRD